MADVDFRQALRRWGGEGTEEARDRVIHIAARQGMDIWDMFLYMTDFSTLHQARANIPRKDLDRVLDLLGDLIAPLEKSSSAEVYLGDGLAGWKYHIGYIDYQNRGQAYIITAEGLVFSRTEDHRSLEVHDPEIVDNIRTQRA